MKGDGTRGNAKKDGKCDCNAGYKGDLCDECQSEFYFEANKNTTFIQCSGNSFKIFFQRYW